MPNILTSGKTFHPQLDAMPIQQEQGASDVFGILDQQYQKESQDIEMQFGQLQEEILRDVRYKLKTLSDKYQQERSYIEGLKVPADQKRQKLLQLNNKYELAAITARSKTKPDIDGYNTLKQQKFAELQQNYQQRKRDIQLIDELVADGTIKDPDVAKQKKYAIVGVSLPISAFREPKELSMEQIAEQQANLQFQIMNLEEAAKTATGKEKEGIVAKILDLENQRVELMGVALPEYKTAVEKSNKLSKVGLQMSVGRKPGTLAEGVWQKKQKQSGVNLAAFRGWAPGFNKPVSKRKETKQQPTPAELRAKGTKEAFEEGVKLGYWK